MQAIHKNRKRVILKMLPNTDLLHRDEYGLRYHTLASLWSWNSFVATSTHNPMCAMSWLPESFMEMVYGNLRIKRASRLLKAIRHTHHL